MLNVLALSLQLLAFNPSDTLRTYYYAEVPVISSIRADERTPISETTLDSADINKSNFGQEIPYHLSRTPSVTVQSDAGYYGGYTYMRIRGIDHSRINFTLNGMPLNEPEDQGAYFSNTVDFAKNMNSVQIQRGVGTSTYGVASYGGSVNFQFNPMQKFGSIDVGKGSYNSERYSFAYSTGLTDANVSMYARFSQLASDGYRYNSRNNSHSVFSGAGWYSTNDAVQLILIHGYETCNLAWMGATLDDISVDPRTNYLRSDELDEFYQTSVQLIYSHQFNSKIGVTTQVYDTKLSGHYTAYYSDPNGNMHNFRLKSNWIGNVSTLNILYSDFSFYTGASAYTYTRHHSMKLAPFYDERMYEPMYENSGNKVDGSIFAKGYYYIGNLTLYSDIQFRSVKFDYKASSNHFISTNPITWNFFNPRFGAKYFTFNGVEFYGSIGWMHREPTRSDMFAGDDDMDSVNYSQIYDFTSVKPEEVADVELGIKIHSIDNLKIEANVYNMAFKNEIAAIGQLNYIGTPLRTNVPSSYRRGLEFLIEYFINNFTIGENFTYSYARINEYAPKSSDVVYHNVIPVMTPSLVSNTSVDYHICDFVNLITDIKYVGESYINNENTYINPEYFTADATAKFHFDRDMTLTMQVNNIFDKHYVSAGYVYYGTPLYFASAQRNYFVTLTRNF